MRGEEMGTDRDYQRKIHRQTLRNWFFVANNPNIQDIYREYPEVLICEYYDDCAGPSCEAPCYAGVR